jgi:S-(hydroxymethyl)glutathione dehydrogenase/alcohol dehydrogenase
VSALTAYVLREPRSPLREESLTARELAGDLVRVRILATGVCRSDLHATDGEWTTPLPLVPGHEGAGVVEAVGPEVRDLVPGDRVVLCWQAPCRRCRACAEGRPWLCSGTRALEHLLPGGEVALATAGGEPVHAYLGLGTFAEQTIVPESGAIRIEQEVPAAVAALIGCAVATGVGAVVRTAGVRPGESAVVVGCGGVGQSALLGLRLVGADPIIAIDRLPDRREHALALGATHALDGRDPELTAHVRGLTDGGAQHAFEAIGLPETLEQLPGLIGRGGQGVIVGMPAEGVTIQLDPFDLADQGKRLLGCNYGSCVPQVDFPSLAQLFTRGLLPLDRLIGNRAPLARVDRALADLRAGSGLRTILEPEAA